MPRFVALVLLVLLAAVAALAVGNATTPAVRAQERVHYRINWRVYLEEHRLSTKLGRRVRALRLQLREARTQLARARHVAAVQAPAASSPSAAGVSYWMEKQVAAADVIARESAGDPWPNCPDPYDGSGASWQDTVDCENGGSWLDSPGYYRCGLQFDPMWERRFGRLCP